MEHSSLLQDELSTKGYCIIDNCLPIHLLRQLSEEISMLEDVLKSSPNSVSISDDEQLIIIKPNVLELTLVERSNLLIHNERLVSMIPALYSIWQDRLSTARAFRSCCPCLSSLQELDQLKIAMIKRGGCFPCHTDTQSDTNRLLSVTLYLEECIQGSDDVNPHGGELRIYPYPLSDPVDIRPVFGRMVLFSAGHTFHRVMKSNRSNRTCISMMFYGSDSDSSRETGVPPAVFPFKPEGYPAHVFHRRRLLMPLLYMDEFRRSILESFYDGNGGVEAVEGRAAEYFVHKCRLMRLAGTPNSQLMIQYRLLHP